jgi:hypothetical protein
LTDTRKAHACFSWKRCIKRMRSPTPPPSPSLLRCAPQLHHALAPPVVVTPPTPTALASRIPSRRVPLRPWLQLAHGYASPLVRGNGVLHRVQGSGAPLWCQDPGSPPAGLHNHHGAPLPVGALILHLACLGQRRPHRRPQHPLLAWWLGHGLQGYFSHDQRRG